MQRRRFLTKTGVLFGASGFAGCTSDGTTGNSSPTDEQATESPTPTATPTPTPTPTPTEVPEPSVSFTEVPRYPNLQYSSMADRMFEEMEPPVPPTATSRGYETSDPVEDVASWFQNNPGSWTLEYTLEFQGNHMLTYTQADTGALVMVAPNKMTSGSAVLRASMFESVLFPGSPAIGHLGVAIEPYDPATGRAGGFDFDALQAGGEEPLLFFGGDLGGKLNPAYEYRTAADATVYASIDGVVTKADKNPDVDDYTLHISPTEGSTVFVDHDHVLEPTVSKGDTVSAGEVIGSTGIWGTSGVGRTEVQMTHFYGPHYCPLTNVVPGMRDQLEGKVSQLVSDWEAESETTYEKSFVWPGCLTDTLVETG